MALDGKNITILGAGIGGLTAAIALAGRGANVRVLDQAEALGEVGAGIQITPNGNAVLSSLGVDLAPKAVALEAVVLRNYQDGGEVLRLDMARNDHGQPYLLVHRADLIAALAEAADKAGVILQFGVEVTDIAITNQRATLTFADGSTEQVAHLVGADGIRSVTRAAVMNADAPSFTGQVAWRTIIPAQRGEPNVATVYMGPKRHLVTYPLRGGELTNVVAVEERTDWAPEGWHHTDDPDNLRAAFHGWAPEVTRLLERCEHVRMWGLFAHPVATSWSAGPVVLIGDACHPMLPFLAQGANMAIEDAWVLAEEWDRVDDARAAFVAYQVLREDRVAKVVDVSKGNTKAYHLANPALRFAAHSGLRLAGTVAPSLITQRYDWLYGFDVTKEL